MLIGIEDLGMCVCGGGKEVVEERNKMATHGSGDQKIIRLLLDNDTRLILDPIMRSVSELSLDEIFGTLMNN